MIRAIQYTDSFSSEPEAQAAFGFLAIQDDYLGGRVLPPVNQAGKDSWRVQTFHERGEVACEDLLPDGCRLVMVPESQASSLGIREVAV